MNKYRVKVYKEYFDFASAHFITFLGRCETIHGHNYRVSVALEGERGPDAFVYNFSDLKPVVRRACDLLDHKMLLAAHNPHLKYNWYTKNTENTTKDSEIEVVFGTRRYLFPVNEVVMLPLENTTAELLANYLLRTVRTEMEAQARPELATLKRIEVEVEEQPGQSALYAEDW